MSPDREQKHHDRLHRSKAPQSQAHSEQNVQDGDDPAPRDGPKQRSQTRIRELENVHNFVVGPRECKSFPRRRQAKAPQPAELEVDTDTPRDHTLAKAINHKITRKQKKLRLDWESLGLETFWDINRETGIAEELVVTRRAKRPDTIEYEWDAWVARRAFRSSDVNFREFCLELMRARAAYEVPKPTRRISFRHEQPASAKGPHSYGVLAFKKPDRFSYQLTHWDCLLQDVKAKRNALCERRRWKLRGKMDEAGWALWECRQRRKSRTRLVADEEGGFTAERVVEGVGGSARRGVVRLGYRREQARAIGEDWVTWEELAAIRRAEGWKFASDAKDDEKVVEDTTMYPDGDDAAQDRLNNQITLARRIRQEIKVLEPDLERGIFQASPSI